MKKNIGVRGYQNQLKDEIKKHSPEYMVNDTYKNLLNLNRFVGEDLSEIEKIMGDYLLKLDKN